MNRTNNLFKYDNTTSNVFKLKTKIPEQLSFSFIIKLKNSFFLSLYNPDIQKHDNVQILFYEWNKIYLSQSYKLWHIIMPPEIALFKWNLILNNI